MALTYTPPGEIGSALPTFMLPTVMGESFQSSSLKGFKATVILFICNHCPYVVAIEDRIIQLAKEMKSKGVQFVGICSNDAEEYPEDSPENLKQRWLEKNYAFPYLVDESQIVAKTFGAVCTPDFFVYDASMTLRYRGRFDDSWKNASKVQKQELKTALEHIMTGQKLSSEPKPSMGCSIKWKEDQT